MIVCLVPSSNVKPPWDAACDATLAECRSERWADAYWSSRKKKSVSNVHFNIIFPFTLILLNVIFLWYSLIYLRKPSMSENTYSRMLCWWIGRDLQEGRCDLFEYYRNIFLVRLRKYIKALFQVSSHLLYTATPACPVRFLNQNHVLIYCSPYA